MCGDPVLRLVTVALEGREMLQTVTDMCLGAVSGGGEALCSRCTLSRAGAQVAPPPALLWETALGAAGSGYSASADVLESCRPRAWAAFCPPPVSTSHEVLTEGDAFA